ncbi:MAG: VOC family protein [Woeseiaceae bacterium]
MTGIRTAPGTSGDDVAATHSVVRKLHHINFIVRDLDAAVSRYRETMGFGEPIIGELPQRGVRIARFMVGETWLLLVQPTREDSAPGQFLEENGEGPFLFSFGVENMDDAVASVEQGGARMLDAEPRRGLDDWCIKDLDPDDFFGVQLQFTELL